MSSPTNVEDLESAAEFERIKQNFRSTVISTDVPADILEAQATFQDIQYELQEFILKHLSRTVALQRTILSHFHSESPGSKAADSGAHGNGNVNGNGNGNGAVAPKAFRQSDADPSIIADVVSDQAICNQGVPSRHTSANPVKAPLENHLQSLNVFLNLHIENLHALQNSLRPTADKRPVTTVIQKPPAASSDGNEKFYNGLTQQFSMLVAVSTFTAGLIVAFLSLIRAIISPNHRTAFSVGMLFSFFALFLHLGNIIVAGRGVAITTQYLGIGIKEHDPEYFPYYLLICEQLQFTATLLFTASILILMFYIFSSLAFPIILLVTAVLATFIVFWSAYWKVSITFRNIKFLVQNFRRLRWKTVAYLKAAAREGQHA